MADPADTPGSPEGEERALSLLGTISAETVKTMKKYYGRGPVKAKSHLMDDLLFVVMRGGLTPAEETMLEAGSEDLVREFRQRFENEMDLPREAREETAVAVVNPEHGVAEAKP